MRQAFWTLEVKQSSDSISFGIEALQDDLQQISRETDQILSGIRMHSQNVAQEVAEFNENLEKTAREIVQGRKARHLKQSNLRRQ